MKLQAVSTWTVQCAAGECCYYALQKPNPDSSVQCRRWKWFCLRHWAEHQTKGSMWLLDNPMKSNSWSSPLFCTLFLSESNSKQHLIKLMWISSNQRNGCYFFQKWCRPVLFLCLGEGGKIAVLMNPIQFTISLCKFWFLLQTFCTSIVMWNIFLPVMFLKP